MLRPLRTVRYWGFALFAGLDRGAAARDATRESLAVMRLQSDAESSKRKIQEHERR
jgi:hypothetical protein